jgi:hypothetical protein
MYTEPAFSMRSVENWLVEWGPRILGAIAILVVAYLIGKAVKWALAKGIDKVPGAHHANQGADKNATIGARLGDVGYWLVLLIGIVLALNTLGLTAVSQPLNDLLTQFFNFVPRLVGAILIFFVGFLLATIAKRLVVAAASAANLDGWLQRAGLNKVTGASGLANALGTLVFVLIIIPVAISALQVLGITAISGPAIAVLNEILTAIPNVLVAALILAIAFVIARWVASLIEQLLPSLGFDSSVRGLIGMGGASSAPGYDATGTTTSTVSSGPTPSKIVAQVAFAAIMIFAAVEATRQLQFAGISNVLEEILALGGQVIFGGVIITAGVLIAQLLSRAIDRGTNGADGFASVIVKWATIALSVAIGLRFMGLANDIITLAFGLILGSAAVAAALAFGIGGRQQAARWLEQWSNKAEQAAQQKQAQQQAQSTTPPMGYPPAE